MTRNHNIKFVKSLVVLLCFAKIVKVEICNSLQIEKDHISEISQISVNSRVFRNLIKLQWKIVGKVICLISSTYLKNLNYFKKYEYIKMNGS